MDKLMRKYLLELFVHITNFTKILGSLRNSIHWWYTGCLADDLSYCLYLLTNYSVFCYLKN